MFLNTLKSVKTDNDKVDTVVQVINEEASKLQEDEQI